MKSKHLFVVFALSALVISACRPVTQEPVSTEVPDTGTIIDVTERNGETVSAVPGDVVYVKLTGESDSGKQWSVIAPPNGDIIRLQDHKIIGLADAMVLDGQFTDEWWLKVLEPGTVELSFVYGVLGEIPEDKFLVTINSQ